MPTPGPLDPSPVRDGGTPVSLGRYPSEVRAIADELLELLDDDALKPAAFRVLGELGEDGLLGIGRDDAQKALKLLSQTPSQRDRTLARLDDDAAATLILRARYLGLLSHGAFQIADRLADIRGSSYRGAAELGARVALGAGLAPSLEDIMPDWCGPDHDDAPGPACR